MQLADDADDLFPLKNARALARLQRRVIACYECELRSRARGVKERDHIRLDIEEIDGGRRAVPLFGCCGAIGKARHPHHLHGRFQGSVVSLADLENPHPLLLPRDVRRGHSQ